MTTLQPKPGFDWRRVAWSRRQSALCSYCFAAIGEDDVPLILFADDKAAQFCDGCMAKWWGMQSFKPEGDDA